MLKKFAERNPSYQFKKLAGIDAIKNNKFTIHNDGDICCYLNSEGPWSPVFLVPSDTPYAIVEKLIMQCT